MLVSFLNANQATTANRGVNYEVRAGYRSKLVIPNAISRHPFNNGDRFYNASPFTNMRGVCHRRHSWTFFTWAKYVAEEVREKGDRAQEDVRSSFESPFMTRCKLPLNRSVGAVLPLYGGASSALWLVPVPHDVTAPLALRITSSTRSFEFSQLTGIRHTKQVSPWNSEDCRTWGRIVRLLLISLLHHSVFRRPGLTSERSVVLIFNLSDTIFERYQELF